MGCQGTKAISFDVETVPDGCFQLYENSLKPMELKFKLAEFGYPLIDRSFFGSKPGAEGQLVVELIVRAQRLRAHLYVVQKMQDEAKANSKGLLSGAWVQDLGSAYELDLDGLVDQTYFDKVQGAGSRFFPAVTEKSIKDVDDFIHRDVARFMQVFCDHRQIKLAKQTITELLEQENQRLNRQGQNI
mmetsp:Transcript_55067/g.101943  ORF Transcript_55067/g.101943 Transcript_55067/m.101943 type:complete len:187 (+) Transcript_55067:57-617(+)